MNCLIDDDTDRIGSDIRANVNHEYGSSEASWSNYHTPTEVTDVAQELRDLAEETLE